MEPRVAENMGKAFEMTKQRVSQSTRDGEDDGKKLRPAPKTMITIFKAII